VSESTSFDDLKLSITCDVEDVKLVTRPSEYDEIPVYHSRSKAYRIPLPTYNHFPEGCDATMEYTLEQVNGDPVPSYIQLIGDQIHFFGDEDTEKLTPLEIKLVATETISGTRNEFVTFTSIMEQGCDIYELESQNLADVTLELGDYFVIDHTKYGNSKSSRHGADDDLCGPRSYSLLDIVTNETPTFASHGQYTLDSDEYFIKVHAIDAAMVGEHSVKLAVTLENFPDTILTEEFKITFEEPVSELNLNAAESDHSFNLAWIVIIVLGVLLVGVTIFAVSLWLKQKRKTKIPSDNKVSQNDSEINNETAKVLQDDIDVNPGIIERTKKGDKHAEDQSLHLPQASR